MIPSHQRQKQGVTRSWSPEHTRKSCQESKEVERGGKNRWGKRGGKGIKMKRKPKKTEKVTVLTLTKWAKRSFSSFVNAFFFLPGSATAPRASYTLEEHSTTEPGSALETHPVAHAKFKLTLQPRQALNL